MNDAAAGQEALWHDAALAAALVAIDPAGLGGVWLRARVGPPREVWLDRLRALAAGAMPLVRVPPSVGDDRLLGGLDLAATLAAGRPVAQRGLLADADGGLLLVPMAERLDAAMAARMAAALDDGAVAVERDGIALRCAARLGVVALDEAADEDEGPPPRLTDRLAFHVDLSTLARAPTSTAAPGRDRVEHARIMLGVIEAEEGIGETLCGVAAAFGIAGLRAPLLALRAARAHAALAGRSAVGQDDLSAAARLVLAPRATCLPAAEAASPEAPPPSEPPDAGGDDERQVTEVPPQDLVLEAVRAALPPGLLARLIAGGTPQRRQSTAGRAGAARMTRRRGRPVGAVAGELHAGARLALVETLRAAAPWQPLRRAAEPPGAPRRILVRRDDFRIRRFVHRSETATIFAVDASGSSALHRLAEAKGAVELLLADCYVRRDQVALIAFRGDRAELVLPPTRSLVRAKRSLAGLPGGGGTPLAAALDTAGALAHGLSRRGQTPVLVLLTDGRANIARDGSAGRAAGEEDALAAARAVGASGLASILVDTSPRPQRQAEALARAMGARYLPLPSGDSAQLASVVRTATA